MSYKKGDYVIVRSEETIRKENDCWDKEYFYTKDGVRFGKGKAVYCGRLLRVCRVFNHVGHINRYNLSDPVTGSEITYNDGGEILFSDDMLCPVDIVDEKTIYKDCLVWVRPWNEIVEQADSYTDINEPDCTVHDIWITDAMKDMCCNQYRVLFVAHDPDEVTVATLRDENGTTWNFPLSTLYCCSEYVSPTAAQPTIYFEELFTVPTEREV